MVNQIGPQANSLLPYISQAFGLSSKELETLVERLWRFSTSIRQPRKDDGTCNKTPFFDRWDTNSVTSHLKSEDPRYATQAECEHVCAALLALLLEAHDVLVQPTEAAVKTFEAIVERPFQPQGLCCVHTNQSISRQDIKTALIYSTQGLGSYEIPVSYRKELNQGGRHEHTNVGWMKPLHVNYRLRSLLRADLAKAGASADAIKNALQKIQVKAYCTDKVTMPPHFSNRDVRWATWPDGIQYASHYQCAMIEMELMAQLYEFASAPILNSTVVSSLSAIRGRPLRPGSRCCFITGKILDFQSYVQAAVNPKGGISAYHVGHIHPLTRGGQHAWDNIAWMSDDGNRIQGNDTLQEIEAKLVDAVEYHLRRDVDSPTPLFNAKVRQLWDLLNDIRSRLGKSEYPW